MKKRKTHYVLESIDEVGLLFSNEKATALVRSELERAMKGGDVFCLIVVKKKDIIKAPVIDRVITRKSLEPGMRDYIRIEDFLHTAISD